MDLNNFAKFEKKWADFKVEYLHNYAFLGNEYKRVWNL